MIDRIVKWIDENVFEYVSLTKGIGINIYKGFDSERMIADLKNSIEK